MEKSRLLLILSIMEGWFYLAALAWAISLIRLTKKLDMPVMLPYKPLFLRLALCASSLVFAGLMLVVYVLNRNLWEVLILAEGAVASSFTYFVWKLPKTWREIKKASDLNELRFLESNKFKAIFENSPDAIIAFNNKGQIVDWNKAAEIIFGWREVEVIGKNMTLIFPESYRPTFKNNLQQYLKTGKKTLLGKTTPLEGIRKTGEHFKIELSLSSYLTRDEMRFICIIREMTKRN